MSKYTFSPTTQRPERGRREWESTACRQFLTKCFGLWCLWKQYGRGRCGCQYGTVTSLAETNSWGRWCWAWLTRSLTLLPVSGIVFKTGLNCQSCRQNSEPLGSPNLWNLRWIRFQLYPCPNQNSSYCQDVPKKNTVIHDMTQKCLICCKFELFNGKRSETLNSSYLIWAKSAILDPKYLTNMNFVLMIYYPLPVKRTNHILKSYLPCCYFSELLALQVLY